MQVTNKIAVTGLGVVCAIANTINDFWNALQTENSSIKNWDDLKHADFKYIHACRVTDFECDPLHRGFHFSVAAIEQAITQANCKSTQKWGLFLGTTMGESAAFEAMAEKRQTLNPEEYTGFGICKRLVKKYPKIKIFQCFATACAAGNYALKAGIEALQKDEVSIAIVGGVDPFSRIAMTGFSRSRAMSASGICKPFDVHRDGMVLGEGAGFLVLEKVQNATQRNANILAVLEDCALSCDAYHPTAPKPDSSGIIDCFTQLLNKNNLNPTEIDWISAHGTGTKLSDQSEAQAIAKVFTTHKPYVSSIKPKIGHTLGAATAIEAIVSVLSIQHQTIPHTINYKDAEFDILIPKKPVLTKVNKVLNCGYAFGGLNSITLFSSWN
ncbi:beta-ketoacyl-[acyl-carrier-protein] synthase family protein [Lacinutrix sp. C3R15]|uniref:beta-ketoacyl-[acyl-carrier-protein] synthase family protein n=1 Tax=Flavobacteriaceae TaxID=49546 RepID=UPI001C0A180C|nr:MULTISPECIES: beta-ketoacyl-[acyl-carrier-protein] synthase family protein [Flavobacteriaceae]MBU2940123.1 beta-ketoacyl-[acyl-carrier-protein] synthase family protein [Lacinutrix sp. C3R15]MDO6623440.1 beta-ketoacyl-[acyl-carrier-protein] synthase family protein [Oceanihabitans sp. 1_MG-2023]